jgi:hypothetical protein
MPRRRPPAVAPPTALVASVARFSGNVPRIYAPKQDWQTECYRHYAICGEARFASKFFGNAVSRARLLVDQPNPDGEPREVKVGPPADALAALFGGAQNQTQMLAAVGMHLTIAGECYLVGRTVDTGDVWEVISVTEMQVTGTTWTINYGSGAPSVTLGPDDVVLRVWLPNPRRQMEADSPFRSLLPILSEIEWLTRHIFAQITSRLAGAGVLMMPQSMTFPPPPAQDGQEVATTGEADAFMMTLANAMMTPIEDPGSPSAVIPIVVTGPDDAIANAKLMTFWSELDQASLQMRGEAIKRFALGMDLPPEQILGMSTRGSSSTGGGAGGGMSHWGAWQVEEATIKLHVEPMLDVICQALTVGYLNPLLGDTNTSYITYDTSALRLRPDRSKEAFELYDRGLISAEACRRENGFDEDDAPAAEELKTWLLMKVASGSVATPEQLGAALNALGVNIPISYGAPGTPAPPPPSLVDHPSNDLPAASLVAACDALVFRAMERAGNRLRTQGTKPPGVPSYETHLYVKGNPDGCLTDAWSCADKVLAGIADPAEVIPVLNAYCHALIAEQSPHQRDRLAEWLRLAQRTPVLELAR